MEIIDFIVIIGVIATIIGAYFGYKQYVSSKETTDSNLNKTKESQSKKVDEKPSEVKPIIRKENIENEPKENSKSANENIKNINLTGEESILVHGIKITDSDVQKVNMIKNFFQGKTNKDIKQDEIVNILSCFSSDIQRNNGLKTLIFNSQNELSNKQSEKILSFYTSDKQRSNAVSIIFSGSNNYSQNRI